MFVVSFCSCSCFFCEIQVFGVSFQHQCTCSAVPFAMSFRQKRSRCLNPKHLKSSFELQKPEPLAKPGQNLRKTILNPQDYFAHTPRSACQTCFEALSAPKARSGSSVGRPVGTGNRDGEMERLRSKGNHPTKSKQYNETCSTVQISVSFPSEATSIPGPYPTDELQPKERATEAEGCRSLVGWCSSLWLIF